MNDELEKMKLHSPDWTKENIRKLAEIFPNCVTETRNADGTIKRAIDYDQLRQELSDHIVDGPQERYHLNWPGKREALLAANAPISKTLRPASDESVNFDTTQNLFIEGDNLETLKLLQETYLGKVKMIYIDPPYNTGNDFIYEDDFAESANEFLERSNQKNEEGNRLIANPDSKGRFHSDWLSMMYSRLRLAKNLLSDDGCIFISIDDGEYSNLKNLCNEIFGEQNFRNSILVRRRVKSLNSQFADSGLATMNVGTEYVLLYSKSPNFVIKALQMQKTNKPQKGSWNVFWSNADRPTMRYNLLGFTPDTGQWRWVKEKAEEGVRNYEEYLRNFSEKMSLEEYWSNTGKSLRFIRRIDNGTGKNGGVQYWVGPSDTSLRTSNWTDIEVSQIHKDFDLGFTNPKNPNLIKTLTNLIYNKDFLVLDFFAGSSTTAHAVMELNAEDGGNRKFIMVQLPEECDPKSEAAKVGYSNIAEISKERIRRAGAKILESEYHQDWNKDIGFRVLKVDTSNMKDVYYRPDEVDQSDLLSSVDNIKPDRTGEDLLFQVLVDWGVDLTLSIHHKKVDGKSVYFVDDDGLIACFETGINVEFVKQLATHKPLRVVFRDNGFVSDDVKANVAQIFRQTSPDTDIKVI